MKPLYTRFKSFVIAAIVAATLALAGAGAPAVYAQTPNVTVGAGQVVVISFHLSGQYAATTAGVARFALPFPGDVLGVQASARASGGTAPTLTVDVQAGGVSILSTPVAVTAGAVAQATLSTATLADEAAMTVNLAIGGTSPTWNDIVVMMTVARR